MVVPAPAKVNLALRVTGRRADGYHELHSLAVFAGIGDELFVSPAANVTLEVDGPTAPGVPTDGSNLVLKAAEALRAARGVTAGARLRLTKRLPHGAGIGGGSSDAAAAIRGLAALWRVAPLTAAEALPLGADLPVCLAAPAPQVMAGIGERLTPAPALPPCGLLLANPGVPVPTGPVFRALSGRFGAPLPPLPPAPDFVALTDWLAAAGNDLSAPAEEVCPAITAVRSALSGAPASGMSGSGATCWALLPDPEAAARLAAEIARHHPDWWLWGGPLA
ncbi:4-(cytidine 5'-diphospho)-2-C-methyl-D-erythritol kinase [Pseudoroseicyclus sp. CLL3-39]|uniref:4-diphosphocytidyl-2-C-methyl-D-erythritol kinase n=1 Tax=Pseudoroseicyclus tamaricis TaxID=2705421 RepID=A0A6B2JZD9_9RHOB|nr:4-(cytidine 5'-diphospho)-2-C-methyl-D-erythritol kinase [Pseudoroseicyclus tamaricis]